MPTPRSCSSQVWQRQPHSASRSNVATYYPGTMSSLDLETTGIGYGYDPNDTSAPMVYVGANTPDPYAGLNRAQRRKAISVESRAWRQRTKGRRGV